MYLQATSLGLALQSSNNLPVVTLLFLPHIDILTSITSSAELAAGDQSCLFSLCAPFPPLLLFVLFDVSLTQVKGAASFIRTKQGEEFSTIFPLSLQTELSGVLQRAAVLNGCLITQC